MSGRGPEARRLIGAGLLLPALLLLPPASGHAEGRAAKPQAKRTVPKAQSAPKAEDPAGVRTIGAPKGDERCVHVVRRGDTLARLAVRYHVSRQAMIAGNQLSGPGALRAGQSLSIPRCKSVPKRPLPSPAAIELDDGLLLARVGPQRVPTRLYVAVPEFGGEVIEFNWPVEGPLAWGFGRRGSGWHAGIDIQAEVGTPVQAAAAGTVLVSGWAASYGRVIKIQHPNGFMTVYAHNSENLVQVGDEIEAGAVIATVGTSGRVGRVADEHLHFEIRRDGMAFNPLYLLEARDAEPILVSATAEPVEDGAGDYYEVP